MEKSTLICLVILLLASLSSTAILSAKQPAAPEQFPTLSEKLDLSIEEPVYYIGNKQSKIYHRHDCHYVDRMLLENMVFFETAEEAEEAGYRRCEVCGGNKKLNKY